MKIALILLASGKSDRFGANKLLQNIAGAPMYQHIIDICKGLDFSERIIVTQYDEIAPDGYKIIRNNSPERGISHSIELGVLATETDCDAYMFSVCDMPNLRVETVEKLLGEYRKSGRKLGCISYNGEFGNPNIFSSQYRDSLLALEGDSGGKRLILDADAQDICNVAVYAKNELFDIDTELDMKNIAGNI